MHRATLDSRQTGAGTDQYLILGRTEQVRKVVIEQCGSRLSVPTSGSGTLKVWWRWDIRAGSGDGASSLAA